MRALTPRPAIDRRRGKLDRDGDRRRGHRAAARDGVDRRRRRPVRARCARPAATGSGCARSTPRRRRRSTSARRPGATSASAATSRATCSRSSRSIEHVDFVGAVEHLAAKAGIQLTLHVDRAVARAGRGASGSSRRWRRPSSGTTSGCSTTRRPARRATTCAAVGCAATSPAVQARLGARRLGRAGPRSRASTASCCGPPAWRSPTGATGCRTRSGPGCCSRSSPTAARRWPSAGGSCPARTTRRSTRTRRRRRSTPSRKTLYGLNWAKADIVAADQVVVCEGYTDVIGFHRAGVRAGGGDVRHGVHRGARPPAQALRQPGRAGLRRRRRRPGRGRALLRVGAEVPGAGRRRPAARTARTPASWPSATRGACAAAVDRRRAVPRLPPASGCSTAGRRARRRTGPAWPSGRWRSSTSTPTSTCASSTPARWRSQVGLPVADLVARGRAARRGARRSSVGAAPARRARGRTPSSSPSPCWSSDWDVDRRVAGRGAVRRRARTGGRSSPWPPPRATSTRRSSAADPEAREVLERAAVADVDVEPERRGAQPDRRRRAPRAGRAGRRPATPS